MANRITSEIYNTIEAFKSLYVSGEGAAAFSKFVSESSASVFAKRSENPLIRFLGWTFSDHGIDFNLNKRTKDLARLADEANYRTADQLRGDFDTFMQKERNREESRLQDHAARLEAVQALPVREFEARFSQQDLYILDEDFNEYDVALLEMQNQQYAILSDKFGKDVAEKANYGWVADEGLLTTKIYGDTGFTCLTSVDMGPGNPNEHVLTADGSKNTPVEYAVRIKST